MSTKPRPRVSRGGAAGSIGIVAAAIISSVVQVEGGFVDHRDDPGGATNYGITERVARANGYRGSMRNFPESKAWEIYNRQYIIEPGFGPLVESSYGVGHKVVDIGVNAGPRRPSCWLQQGLNAFNSKGRDYSDITVDCDVGPATMRAWTGLKRRRGTRLACELILKYLDGKQAAHYSRLADRSQRFETFMVGWFRTRIQNVQLSDCTKTKEDF